MIDIFQIHDTLSKKVICKKLKLQIEKEKELISKYNYDKEKAQRVVNFLERYITNYKGEWAGKKIELELWELHFIHSVYGIVDDNGYRICKEALLLITRKHGKTLLAAGLGLYHLTCDNEAGPEVYTVANKLDQARILFEDVYTIIKYSKLLNKILKKRRTDIQNKQNNGKLMPLASDSTKLDGLNTSFGVLDEVHAMKDIGLYDVITTSTGARRQALIIMITTNGTVRESVFDMLYEEHTEILLGVNEDDSRFSFIYELDDKEEIHDKKMWIKANPGIEYRETLLNHLEEQYKKALASERQMVSVLTKNFNVPQVSTEIFFNKEECYTKEFDESIFKNAYITIGIDYASMVAETSDFTCIGFRTYDALNQEVYDKKVYFIPKNFYIKKTDTIENAIIKKSKYDKINYQRYIDNGDLIVIDDTHITNKHIYDFIDNFVKENNCTVVKIGIDPYGLGEFEEKIKQNTNDKKFIVTVKSQQREWNTPRIYKMKERRNLNRVNNNNKLDIIQFANSIAKVNYNGMIYLDTLEQNKRNDGVIVELCLETATELFYNNLTDDEKKEYIKWCVKHFENMI